MIPTVDCALKEKRTVVHRDALTEGHRDDNGSGILIDNMHPAHRRSTRVLADIINQNEPRVEFDRKDFGNVHRDQLERRAGVAQESPYRPVGRGSRASLRAHLRTVNRLHFFFFFFGPRVKFFIFFDAKKKKKKNKKKW
jgi:hypothetical protein